MSITHDLAKWLAELRYNDLPTAVVDVTKRFLLDDVGCMLGGALQLGNKALHRVVRRQREQGTSTIAVYGTKTSPTNAALINGAFICGWDYDSGATGGGHMGSQTAALLAMAEIEPATGEEIVTAECAGIEAQCRIGIATDGVGEAHTHPWHSNTTLGPFAAAVTAGKLLGLDAETMEHAIALAAQTLGGNYQHYYGRGSSMKRIRCGIGAWSGIRAALLAHEGILGPPGALDGERGYLRAMHGREPARSPFIDSHRITEDVGEKWYTHSYRTKGGACFCCSACGSALETALALKRRHRFDPRDIESVSVTVPDMDTYTEVAQHLGAELGTTPVQRLATSGWSIRWMLAETLLLGCPTIRVQLNNVRPYGHFKDIEELSRRIDWRIDEAYYRVLAQTHVYPSQSGRVVIRMKNGSVYQGAPLPYVGCRMSDGTINSATAAQLTVKLVEQAKAAGIPEERSVELIDVIGTMEEQEGITPLIRLVVREPR
jgi:2-methylcitrate dehydratase PrpD